MSKTATDTDFIMTYSQLRHEINNKLENGTLEADSIIVSQELHYRLSVIQSFREYVMSAPVSSDVAAMTTHYRMVLGFLKCLPNERLYGKDIDKPGITECQKNLEDFYLQTKEFFMSFRPSSDEAYAVNLDSALSVYLCLFRGLRESITKIETKENE